MTKNIIPLFGLLSLLIIRRILKEHVRQNHHIYVAFLHSTYCKMYNLIRKDILTPANIP